MKEDLIGLSLLQDEYLKCGDCHTSLANVIIAETNENRKQRGEGAVKVKFHVYNCPKCGGESFDSPVYEGTVAVGSPSEDFNLDAFDIADIGNGILLTKLRVEHK